MDAIKDMEKDILDNIRDSSKEKIRALFKEMEDERAIVMKMFDDGEIMTLTSEKKRDMFPFFSAFSDAMVKYVGKGKDQEDIIKEAVSKIDTARSLLIYLCVLCDLKSFIIAKEDLKDAAETMVSFETKHGKEFLEIVRMCEIINLEDITRTPPSHERMFKMIQKHPLFICLATKTILQRIILKHCREE